MATESKAVQTVQYDEDTLGDIKSFDDAIALLAEAGVAVTDITDYGDGFAVVAKEELVKSPFVILDYKFADGDYGEPFAIIRAVTKDNRKVVIVDGGTGINKQIRSLESKGVSGGVLCPRGLTVSNYTYLDEKGNNVPATTFYLGM